MKKVWIVFALLLFGTVTTIAVAGSGRESTMLPPQEVEIMYSSEDHAYQMKDLSDVVRWRVLPNGQMVYFDSSGVTRFLVDASGNLTQYNSSGDVSAYTPSERVVYINTYTQLSTWSGQASTAGQSYFQCSPGKIYWIDPYAINASIVAVVGAGNSTFAGVTAILPDASTYSGPGYDVTVGVLTSGTTGYANQITGNTIVYVYPYPGSGTTWYGGQGKTVPQTLLTEYGTTTLELRAGNSYWELNRLGENSTFGLYNGAVSAFVMKKKVIN